MLADEAANERKQLYNGCYPQATSVTTDSHEEANASAPELVPELRAYSGCVEKTWRSGAFTLAVKEASCPAGKGARVFTCLCCTLLGFGVLAMRYSNTSMLLASI